MKRGRRSKREVIQTNILEILNSSSIPFNTSTLRRLISQKLGQNISWNTIQKYLEELVQVNKIQPIPLPHSKIEGKDGLIVYAIKK